MRRTLETLNGLDLSGAIRLQKVVLFTPVVVAETVPESLGGVDPERINDPLGDTGPHGIVDDLEMGTTPGPGGVARNRARPGVHDRGRAGERPGGSFVLYAAIAGLSEAVGVAALYRGLAVGAMSIVAPVGGAIAPVVPVLVGILLGEFPTPIHGAGIVLAVAEIAITSGGRPSADTVAAGGLARAGLRRVTEAWKAYDAPVAAFRRSPP